MSDREAILKSYTDLTVGHLKTGTSPAELAAALCATLLGLHRSGYKAKDLNCLLEKLQSYVRE